MTKVVQIPRHTTTQVDEIVIPAGNLRMDTNRRELRLGDGNLPGGVRIINLDQANATFLRKGEGLGAEVGFPTEGVGLLVRISEETFILRVLAVGDGINVANADGVAANPTVSLDQTWLATYLDDLYASRTQILANAADKILRVQEAWSALTYTTLTYAATTAIDFALGVNFVLTATGDTILGNPTNLKRQNGDVEILASGANRTVTFAANWKLPAFLTSIVIPSGKRAIIGYSVNSQGEPCINGFTQYA